jgi:uncharacterized damage-inducible protein DinB
MDASLDRIFVDYSIKKVRQLSSRIQDCLEKLTDEQVWLRGSESENAIGNLVLHLCGNLRQWILTGVGGAPDVRVREREFSARGELSVVELSERLARTIDEVTHVLAAVTGDRLLETVTIQGYDVTVLEAIYHVTEHFAGHTGQIIFATKAFTSSDLGFYAHLRPAAPPHGQQTP